MVFGTGFIMVLIGKKKSYWLKILYLQVFYTSTKQRDISGPPIKDILTCWFPFCIFCFSKSTDTCWDEVIWPPTRVFHEEYVCCTVIELKASFIPRCTEVIWKMNRRSQDCYFSVCFNHWQSIFIPNIEIFRWGRHPREYWGNTYFHMGITLCSLTYSNNIIPISNVNKCYTICYCAWV